MAHEKLNINITREWASAQAKLEPDTGITAVGGLAHRLSCLEQEIAPALPERGAAVLPPSKIGRAHV